VKKWLICLCFVVFLSGCAATETFETVDDELLQPAMAEVGEIVLTLPPEASAQTMLGADGDRLYFCNGYTAAVQIMPRGDLDRTCRSLCGFGTAGLNILETSSNGQKRFDWVWTAVGEGGDALGRAAVIDDGKYHYCVTLQSEAALAGELEPVWSEIFGSFSVG
jgi:hypothetical protein